MRETRFVLSRTTKFSATLVLQKRSMNFLYPTSCIPNLCVASITDRAMLWQQPTGGRGQQFSGDTSTWLQVGHLSMLMMPSSLICTDLFLPMFRITQQGLSFGQGTTLMWFKGHMLDTNHTLTMNHTLVTPMYHCAVSQGGPRNLIALLQFLPIPAEVVLKCEINTYANNTLTLIQSR